MTRFPDLPKLVGMSASSPLKMLAEDHVTEVSLCFGLYHVRITLKSGFVTDGASVPEKLWPAAGGPWAAPRIFAALPHDGLYQLRWKWRWLCDRIYLAVLRKVGYPAELAELEYAAVRAAGGRHWSDVSEEERRAARIRVKVKLKEWKKKRDEARRIKDPRARAAALAIVHDLKDDMRLDCQRKMADRIKELKVSDAAQSECLASVKTSLDKLESDFKTHVTVCAEDHKVVEEVKADKLKASGVLAALKWLGYLAAAGGGSIVTILIDMVKQAGGAP